MSPGIYSMTWRGYPGRRRWRRWNRRRQRKRRRFWPWQRQQCQSWTGRRGRAALDLPAIIRSTAEALVAAPIQSIAAVTTAAVEARLAAYNRG